MYNKQNCDKKKTLYKTQIRENTHEQRQWRGQTDAQNTHARIHRLSHAHSPKNNLKNGKYLKILEKHNEKKCEKPYRKIFLKKSG